MLPIVGLEGLTGGGRAAGGQWIADSTSNCYHKTCDAWSSDWNLRGAVEDISLFKTTIQNLGNSRRCPSGIKGQSLRHIEMAAIRFG